MKLTTRGKIVVAILISLAIFAIGEISANLWWNGSGFCWGSATKCLAGNL